jgi:hypothetical protein
MGVNQEQYITTVANCFLRDTDLDAIVMKSKTLVNSNIAFNVQEQEIRGGEFNKLLYVYNYGRTGEITLEDARYEPALVAINCGQTIQNQASNVYVFEEEVTLDAGGNGSVTLETPVAGAKAYVQTSTGSIVTKAFTGSNFAMGGGYASQKVKVTYQYSETVDMITIDGTSFPKAYELVLEVKVFDAGGLKEKVQWIFPQFKPSGNFEMPLASESPSTSSMTGKVLATSDDIYGYKKVIPVSSSVTYTAITADVAEVALETGETYALAVYGLRGSGIYAPVTFAANSCTYVSSDETKATVSSSGVITGEGAGTAYITITHTDSSLTDVVEVTVTA